MTSLLPRHGIVFLFILFGLAPLCIHAQSPTHPTINSFGIRFGDGNPNAIDNIADSSITVTYVVSLKDTVNTNKVYVRISSGTDTTGNILLTSYLVHSVPIYNTQNQVVFRRIGDTVYILTVNTTQLTPLNFEVYTEDLYAQKSRALQWQN